MGVDVKKTEFAPQDYDEFLQRLRQETATVRRWAKQGRFSEGPLRIGCELEVCLTDRHFLAAPRNHELLEKIGDPLVTDELARFNMEFNPPPVELRGPSFTKLRNLMENAMRQASHTAEHMGINLVSVGVLPTLSPSDFTLAMMTPRPRYKAMADRIASVAGGRPLDVKIAEGESLNIAVDSYMLEAAATSLQIHLQVPEPTSAAAHNASNALSAPMVAIAANSPFFFGRRLWMESRVPIFEQVLHHRMRGKRVAAHVRRQSFFGKEYLKNSITELFTRNVRRGYPVMLPDLYDDDSRLPHLQLHNGTIWRWNRPVLGFDGDVPSIRIEHRVMPSAPTTIDLAANAAFFVGAALDLGREFQSQTSASLERRLPFEVLRENFYSAARVGLSANFTWLDGREISAQELILELIDRAARGLQDADVARGDIDRFLGIIDSRVRSGQTGAAWQCAFVEQHGGGASGMSAMTGAYWRRQEVGAPLHEWPR